MASTKSAAKPSFVDRFKGNKVFFGIAIAIALAIAGIVLFILSSVVATTKYYVLNTDVPARSQISSSMLTEVVTSSGSQPPNALSLAEVESQDTYAKYGLKTGDVLTQSNTGEKSPLTAGIPDNFTVMSITVDPKNAIAGKITAGDYVDIIGTDPKNDQISKVVLRHVLIADAMTDPSQVSSSGNTTGDDANAKADASAGNGAGTSTEDTLRGGIPMVYTVAVSPQDATKLQLLTSGDSSKISMVLSPHENEKSVGKESIYSQLGDLFNSDVAVGDSGAGTDNTFGQGGAKTDSNNSQDDSESSSDDSSPSPSSSSSD